VEFYLFFLQDIIEAALSSTEHFYNNLNGRVQNQHLTKSQLAGGGSEKIYQEKTSKSSSLQSFTCFSGQPEFKAPFPYLLTHHESY